MNILLLTYQGGIAGSTQSIFFLADGLARRGHKVHVGCIEGSLLYNMLEQSPAVRIHVGMNSKFDVRAILHINQIVRSRNIDIVNPQSSHDRYLSIFSKMIFGFDAKIVHTRRQVGEHRKGQIGRFWVKHTDGLIAVSNGVKKKMMEHGVPESHIEVIHNGTPKEKYAIDCCEKTRKLRDRYGLCPEEIVIGCVARYKRQEQLVKALSHLEQQVTLLFVGISENETLKALSSRRNGKHRIIYTGMIEAEEVLCHYPLFDINVLPSTMEGLSQSLLEAMAMGVPVLATRAAGNIDLIRDSENGLLFEDNDIGELADKIKRLLNDSELRNRCIANGKKTALEEFSIDKTVERHIAYYSSLL